MLELHPGRHRFDESRDHPAWSGAAKLGAWTHLVGVYDAGSGRASIYVNGQLAGTSTGTLSTPWSAGGAFQIGRTLWNGACSSQTTGAILDVRVWQRVLYPSEISALVDPSANALVESNGFDSTWSCPAQSNPSQPLLLYTMSTDASAMAHDLALQGSAQVPASGGGYQGTGLALYGAGYADTSLDPACDGTPGQVLHTDQSFTVSAWVKLGGTTLPTNAMTALSQLGSYTSGFFLGYHISGGNGVWAFSMAAGTTTHRPDGPKLIQRP